VRAWIIAGPEGDIILQSAVRHVREKGERAGRLTARKVETSVAVLFPARISRWMGVVFGRVLACLEHDSPNE
jgi:hypothetical protein